MKAIHVTSLGCPKNFVDSEVMIGLLQQDGWQIVEQPEDADVLLVNTCGFIQAAVEESIEEILTLSSYTFKKTRKLVVTGCLVQRYREKLQAELPEIDLMIGTEGVKDIHVLLRGLFAGDQVQKLHLPERFLMNADLPRRIATPFYRAWMKITEGCSNHCSYCMIPSIRGPLRSREIRDLTQEARRLAEEGVVELTLIAQDLTAYGTENGQKSTLVPLLHSLLERTAIQWIRLLYLYPTGVTEDLLEIMAGNSRILPYLDIPMQHVSTEVLKGMNRNYTIDSLVKIVEQCRRYIPDVALRTTFLVGFPGETEADVRLLESFLENMNIDHVGVFPYANEEGCPSEFFPGQLPDEVKQERLDRILSLQSQISEKIQQKYLGKIEPVLIEGVSRETDLLLEGRTRYQAPDIDGCVYINDGEASPGEIVQVRISESQIYDLVGEILR
ncbi:MAG: 30S ribosomal protein S12 methylthiotransferase RimO [Desulfopila sp.]|jgi:ribosomal protein S12 methylthiotransferase|nr:30S ribosomal protein S12 methylthiotransferase RimO [Desulfopila sp.]